MYIVKKNAKDCILISKNHSFKVAIIYKWYVANQRKLALNLENKNCLVFERELVLHPTKGWQDSRVGLRPKMIDVSSEDGDLVNTLSLPKTKTKILGRINPLNRKKKRRVGRKLKMPKTLNFDFASEERVIEQFAKTELKRLKKKNINYNIDATTFLFQNQNETFEKLALIARAVLNQKQITVNITGEVDYLADVGAFVFLNIILKNGLESKIRVRIDSIRLEAIFHEIGLFSNFISAAENSESIVQYMNEFDVIAYPLVTYDPKYHYSSDDLIEPRINIPQIAAKLTRWLNEALNHLDFELTDKAAKNFTDAVSEIIDNARHASHLNLSAKKIFQRYSGKTENSKRISKSKLLEICQNSSTWYLIATAQFLTDKYGEKPTVKCQFTFVSLGLSIGEAMQTAQKRTSKEACNKYIKFQKNWSRNLDQGTLRSVVALCDGITSDGEIAGGTGLTKILQTLNSLSDEEFDDFHVSLLSGRCHISFHSDYSEMAENVEIPAGRRLNSHTKSAKFAQFFNTKQDFRIEPVPEHVALMSQNIPGTIFDVNFLLRSEYLESIQEG